MLELNQNDLKLLDKYPKYSQDGKGDEAKVLMKFYNPYGRGSWYVLEAEQMYDGKDYLLFGYVESPQNPLWNELGYFTLKELMEVNIPCYVEDESTGELIFIGYGGIEIDRGFKSMTPLGEVKKEVSENEYI